MEKFYGLNTHEQNFEKRMRKAILYANDFNN